MASADSSSPSATLWRSDGGEQLLVVVLMDQSVVVRRFWAPSLRLVGDVVLHFQLFFVPSNHSVTVPPVFYEFRPRGPVLPSLVLQAEAASGSRSVSRATTSAITSSGVDAPAETPTRRTPTNHVESISSTDSTWSTRGFTLRQTSASCAVFALWRPPMITIASTEGASSTAVFCIEVVAPQSVLNTSLPCRA